MKHCIYIIFCTVFTVAFGQPPVEGNKAVTHSAATERTKNESEKKEISEQSGETSILINEFINIHKKANSQPNQKNPTAHQQNQMNDLVKSIERENTNSFEYNLSVFMAGNFNLSKKQHLDAAKKMQPTNRQVLFQSTGANFILQDKKNLITDLKILKEQNTWSANEYSYAKDVLKSLPTNAVLITNGFNDTYPILTVQLVENYRNDVVLIPLFLLQSEKFQQSSSTNKIIQSNNGIINDKFVSDFLQQNTAKNLFIALTVPTSFFLKLSSQLYPVGLTFQYSTSTVNNSLVNQKLWAKLEKSVLSEQTNTNDKQLSANYLPLLINLFEYYKAEKNNTELTEIKTTIKKIGKNIGKENLINELGLNE
jgi:hypothetical protein